MRDVLAGHHEGFVGEGHMPALATPRRQPGKFRKCALVQYPVVPPYHGHSARDGCSRFTATERSSCSSWARHTPRGAAAGKLLDQPVPVEDELFSHGCARCELVPADHPATTDPLSMPMPRSSPTSRVLPGDQAALALLRTNSARATMSSARSPYGSKPITVGASATKFDSALMS